MYNFLYFLKISYSKNKTIIKYLFKFKFIINNKKFYNYIFEISIY